VTIDLQSLIAFADALRVAVLIARPGGSLLHANEAARTLFGFGADEVISLDRRDLCDLADPRLPTASEQRAQTGAFAGRLRFVRRNGERFEGELTSVAVPGADPDGLLWLTVRDLTPELLLEQQAREELEQRRRTEQALLDREEELRALTEATDEALFVHADGVILATNDAAARVYALPTGGVVGRRLVDFIAPESHDLVASHAAEPRSEYEALGMRADGSKFPARVLGHNITFRGRRARLAAIRDLSEWKRLQAGLALADRLATVGALAASVAHEINNPLAFTLLGLDEALRLLAPEAGALAVELREVLRQARTGAERVQTIVRDLRTFSREDGDAHGPVDVQAVVEYAARVAAAEIRPRARLVVEVSGVPPVLGNETRLGQVLLNLLVNAAHAIPEGDAERNTITVRGRAEDEHVVVEVSDTGVGIEPERLEHIFEPWVTGKPGRGTGLGLTICRELVARGGGTIAVESTPGRGTTFRVCLPLALRPVDEPHRAAPVAAAEQPERRLRVLVIDDEPLLRRMIGNVLNGHDVTLAASAAEALAVLDRGEVFDTILCDLMMPGTTGMELYARLRRERPEAADRVVFLTGGVFTRQAEELLATSGRPWLNKPFTAAELQRAVSSAVSWTGRRTPA
jgi:PAS domain S-box-containing protein